MRRIECEITFTLEGEGVVDVVFQVGDRTHVNSNPCNETHECHKNDLRTPVTKASRVVNVTMILESDDLLDCQRKCRGIWR